jgi:hypothetical protein
MPDPIILEVEDATEIKLEVNHDGLSAYEVALVNGFVGTEAEWLASLQGSPEWGLITGTLGDQLDLKAALDAKQNSLGFTAENVANKKTDLTSSNASDYPNVPAVNAGLALKQNVIAYTPENLANKGIADGYAGLDSGGKVPAAQLPSFVDDVLEYSSTATFPGTGETGKIYVALDTNKTYRWSGSVYVEISPSPGSTDSVTEGSTNLYFTTARVLAALLTGLSLSTSQVIAATDSVLQALGYLQAQITALTTTVSGKESSSNKDSSGGYVGLTLWKINFRNAANSFTSFLVNTATAARTYTFPNKDITVAGLDDVAGASGLVESLSFEDIGVSIPATTYTLEYYAAYAYTINLLKIISDSGTATAAVKINGTSVTGISAVSVSSTVATGTATAANTVAVGDKVTLVVTSPSGLNNLQASLKITRS